MHPTQLLTLDLLPYDEALALMRGLVDLKHRGEHPEILIILEHEPVLTMGRASKGSDILVSKETLANKGIAVHKVERGGLITYHGPGQIVVYPIFNLRVLKLGVVDLVQGLERIVLDTLSDFSIKGELKKGYRGVWVDREKIASIGIAVSRGISFHGLALNYDPDLSHFDLINPCGLNGVRMTSMSKILGTPIDPSSLRETMTAHFKRYFQLDLSEYDLTRIREDAGLSPAVEALK